MKITKTYETVPWRSWGMYRGERIAVAERHKKS